MNCPQRTLVIGAAGFLGGHIARGLRAGGFGAYGLAARRPADLHFDGFHIGRSDNLKTLDDAISGCHAVVFAAGSTRPGHTMQSAYAEVGTETGHVLDVATRCADRGVKTFVYLSSGGAIYGRAKCSPISENQPLEPISLYGLTRLATEHGLRIVSEQTGMRTVCLRIANPYGSGQAVKGSQGILAALANALENTIPLHVWGDGSVIRDYIYVGDVVTAVLAAITVSEATGPFNVGSGCGTTLLELIRMFEIVTNSSVQTVFEPARVVDVPEVVLDISKAKKILGWSPRVSLEEGLRITLS